MAVMFISSGGLPPGLSVSQANRVTGKQPLQRDELLLRKVINSLIEQ